MKGLMRLVVGLALASPAMAVDYYYIVNTSTRMMVEVFAHETGDGARVVLWPHYGGESQQFEVDRGFVGAFSPPRERQWFLLRARHSGKCLKAAGEQTGAPVVQATCNGDASQLWRERVVEMKPEECGDRNRCFGGRRVVLENMFDHERRCLDSANGAFPRPPPQGAGIQAWDCMARFSAPNFVNQEWQLVRTQDWNAPGPRLH
jgi:hypothetical protein